MATLFTKLSPAAARLATLVAGRLHERRAVLGGREWRFAAAGRRRGMHGVTLYGVWGGQEFTAWLDDPDWRLAVASVLDLPPEAVADLPEPLRRAALEAFAGDAMAGLEKALALPLSLTRLEVDATAPSTAALPFRLLRDDGLALGGAWVVAERDGSWRRELERALEQCPPVARDLPQSLPLEAVVNLGGEWRVRLSLLSDLERGDVLLPPSGAIGGGGARRVVAGGRLAFDAERRGGVVLIQGKSMTTNGESGEVSDLPVGLDEAEVNIEARVGRMILTLGQLRQLAEGQVLEFSTPVEEPVVLAVGGKAVARGELVDVGGKVGVRIVSMGAGE